MEPIMTKTFTGCCSALLVFGLQSFTATPATAQAAPSGQEEVTVDGPYVFHQQTTKRAMNGQMAEKTISVSQQVSYSDLDLSKAGDVETLRTRVKTAAKDDCRELDRRFSPSIYVPFDDRRSCVRHATGQALARVDAIASQSLARANTGATQTV